MKVIVEERTGEQAEMRSRGLLLLTIVGICVIMVLAAMAAPTVGYLLNYGYDLACTGVPYDYN